MATYHIIVSGKVQGVFFRVSTRDKARELNLSGWVKNGENGNVEIMASGDETELQLLAEWCRTGPPEADVAGVTVNPIREILFEAFEIIR